MLDDSAIEDRHTLRRSEAVQDTRDSGSWSLLADGNHYLEAGLPPARLDAVSRFIEPLCAEGAIPARVKLFMLYIAATIRGNSLVADKAFDAAVEAGLTREEFADGLLAGTLSRGAAVFLAGAARLQDLPSVTGEWGDPPREARPQEMLAYFDGILDPVPQSVLEMSEYAPGVLQSYFGLRSVVLADGPLPQKYKELLVAAINMIERYDWGMQLHLKAALRAGATHAEGVEAILVAVALGGIPVWLDTSPVLTRLWADQKAAS